MRKFISLAFLIVIFSNNVFSQKLYVWCQKEQIATPRNGFLADKEIDLIVFDGRIMTQKSKIECTSETITNNLALLIRSTYPSAKINLLTSENYYKTPRKDIVTIKIAISAYHAAFGGDVKVGIGIAGGEFGWGVFPEGKWNAATGYSVKIYDYSNGDNNKFTKNIGKVASKPNNGGFITAKNILNTTYIEANQELFFFIDDCFM